MPFPVTHLMIGYNIIESTDKIENEYEFLMGCIAPDAVHHRDDFCRALKSESHLCVGEEPWGMVSNNDAWQENILSFLKANMTQDNRDFLLGYCTHVLTDLQNNIKIWIPFRLENDFVVGKGLMSRYHDESNKIDLELYLEKASKNIWDILDREQVIDCNLLSAVDYEALDRIRTHLLKKQYVDRVKESVEENTCVTMDIIMDFIEQVTEEVKGVLLL